jgi:3-hydroxybutyryl-CoA dehydrogenase
MAIESIAIVGAGELGRRVACACLLAGYTTILEDISPSMLEQGIAWIVQAIGDECARGKIDRATFVATMAKLRLVRTAEDACREADLIIETVADEIEMKIELFTIFDKFARPGAILASTTSSLAITDLAEVTFCPERCIGMRFSAGADRSGKFELIAGRATSEEAIAACREVALRMVREVTIVRDEQGFATGCPECGSACQPDPITKENPSAKPSLGDT